MSIAIFHLRYFRKDRGAPDGTALCPFTKPSESGQRQSLSGPCFRIGGLGPAFDHQRLASSLAAILAFAEDPSAVEPAEFTGFTLENGLQTILIPPKTLVVLELEWGWHPELR